MREIYSRAYKTPYRTSCLECGATYKPTRTTCVVCNKEMVHVEQTGAIPSPYQIRDKINAAYRIGGAARCFYTQGSGVRLSALQSRVLYGVYDRGRDRPWNARGCLRSLY